MKKAKNFIKKAIKHPGALHTMLGIPQGQTIPADRLAAATRSADPLEKKRAIFAQTLKGMHGGR